MSCQQPRDFAEDDEAHHQADANDDEQNAKNADYKNPVTFF